MLALPSPDSKISVVLRPPARLRQPLDLRGILGRFDGVERGVTALAARGCYWMWPIVPAGKLRQQIGFGRNVVQHTLDMRDLRLHPRGGVELGPVDYRASLHGVAEDVALAKCSMYFDPADVYVPACGRVLWT
eukprot:scaffold1373_cov367-Pinguiococcus_pyrenoidosus.AAC.23